MRVKELDKIKIVGDTEIQSWIRSLPSGKSTRPRPRPSVTLIYTENMIHVSLFEVLSSLRRVKSDCAKLPTHGLVGRIGRSLPPWSVKVRTSRKFTPKKPSRMLCTPGGKIGLSEFLAAHKNIPLFRSETLDICLLQSLFLC